jgi:hypothetical protein
VLQGENHLQAYINDTLNNTNTTNITFFVDSLVPNITLIYPTKDILSNHTEHTIMFNASDNNVLNCTLYINETANISTIMSGPQHNFTIRIQDKSVYWFVRCVDDYNNAANSLGYVLTTDTNTPNLTILSPTSNTYYDLQTVSLNISYDKRNTSIYNLNGINTTFSTDGIHMIAKEGNNTLILYLNDSFGNKVKQSLYFHVDTINQKIQSLIPKGTPFQTNSSVPLSFNFTDYSTTMCLYDLGLFRYLVNTTSMNLTTVNQSYNYSILDSSYTQIVSPQLLFDGNMTMVNFTIDLPDSNYTYNITCEDALGHQTTTAASDFFVDAANPSMFLLNATVVNNTIYIQQGEPI